MLATSFKRRLVTYLAIWLVAALAFEILLQPEGLTETDLTPFQQRIRMPVYVPLMAVIGLAQSVTWPTFPDSSALDVAAACLVLHAVVALSLARRGSFLALATIQTLLLTIAVIYFIHHSHLPSGP
jgi:hypothetical protein